MRLPNLAHRLTLAFRLNPMPHRNQLRLLSRVIPRKLACHRSPVWHPLPVYHRLPVWNPIPPPPNRRPPRQLPAARHCRIIPRSRLPARRRRRRLSRLLRPNPARPGNRALEPRRERPPPPTCRHLRPMVLTRLKRRVRRTRQVPILQLRQPPNNHLCRMWRHTRPPVFRRLTLPRHRPLRNRCRSTQHPASRRRKIRRHHSPAGPHHHRRSHPDQCHPAHLPKVSPRLHPRLPALRRAAPLPTNPRPHLPLGNRPPWRRRRRAFPRRLRRHHQSFPDHRLPIPRDSPRKYHLPLRHRLLPRPLPPCRRNLWLPRPMPPRRRLQRPRRI